jgi:hypothetical protein
MGLIANDDPTLVLLRRYETASFRRQKWALDMLHRGRQRVEPIPSMTHDYRERPRQAPHVREEAAPVPTSEGPTPPPAPEPPARGPATGRDRQQPGPVQQAGRVQPAPPGPFAGRDLLAGHMLRLARSLAAPRTARRSPRLSSKPGRRMSRPTPATSRPARAGMLRLVAAPAA